MPYIPLSINNIQKFQDGLRKIQAYEDDIDRKMDIALDRLLAEGITVCYANSSVVDMVDDSPKIINNMIIFRQEDVTKLSGYSEVALVGMDLAKIISRWRYKGGIKEVQVSPLLMAEFGSGKFADNAEFKISGVGRGTFPGQTHAFENSWHWLDLDDGQRHFGSGVQPTQPMLKGRNAMMVRITTIFREVFN